MSVTNRTYDFFETTQLQPLPALLKTKYLHQNIEETLSLEMMKELRANDTEAIDLLHDRNKKGFAANLTLSLMTILFTVILLVKTKILKRSSKTSIIPTTLEAIPSVHTSMPELSDTRKPE